MYDPKTKKYPYPEITDQHYLKVKKDNGLVFDENYPFIDESKKAKNAARNARGLLNTIVFPMTRMKMGLKIENKENIKIYKDVLDNGVITVSNHVHLWDYIAIMKALRPYKPRILVWPKNIRGENGKLIRATGGIPIPDDSLRGMKKFKDEVDKYLQNGGILHIDAEGSMWEYYQPIRPFKIGAAKMAVRNDKPILPIGFSYRKPNFIRKMFRQPAAITLKIGEPIYPNKDLPVREREVDLLIRCHEAVCRLAGIDPKENIYGPVFNDSHRIDYY